ncbi:hypothetical protein ASG99_13270 [Bacillus sp. Soil768D1]|nr:hypothetical protein ASG99_13270 [Bacillus sp. Soil768D1]
MIEVARYIKIIATKQLIKNLFFDILMAKIKLPLHFQFIVISIYLHHFHYTRGAMFLPGDNSLVKTSAHQVFLSPKEGEGSWGTPIISTKVTEIAWDILWRNRWI